jgi:hypothetical protein
MKSWDVERNRKVKALLITFALVAFCFLTTLFLTDSPVSKLPTPTCKIAAIAIRDNVIAEQKYGTRLFSFPYLKKYYTDVAYFTQSNDSTYQQTFTEKLTELLVQNDSVDVYLLAHSNSYYRWFTDVDSNLRTRLRLVYNTGCSGAQQAHYWKELGARYYVAHESAESISPVFYFYFLRRFTNGHSLSESIYESNKAMHQKLKRIQFISFGLIHIDEVQLIESEGKRIQ